METLEATETLADDSSKKPPESQTLEAPAGPRVSGLGFPSAGETLAPGLGAEGKTLGSGLPPEDDGEGEERHFFAVGDFVWGKIKSHPWWPGQVYDPSRASDHAKRVHRRDRSVLVAYFGDDTFAWCHPAQLRPFVPAFHRMVKQSSSKSFVGAVEDALGEIGRCLELELTCPCVPPEAWPASARGQVGRVPLANFAPLEFLEHLRDVARDVSVVDMLEGAMLKSWVMAFGKGWRNGSAGYHRRRGIMELVDKIDLDVPPGDLADSKEEEEEEVVEEEEYWITGSTAVKGPKISAEKLFRSRKKRSMAKLIAEMDLDAVEVSDGEEKVESGKRKKNTENEKGPELENSSIKAEEEGGSGRRERKKSKYLSPPYTYLSGYSKFLASPRSAETKTPRKSTDSSAALPPKSPTILKCNCDTVQKEEDKMSPPFQVDSNTSVHEILAEFLCTAVNPLHLKWNRLAKTIRGFFAIYRSSLYSSGSDFVAYQKHLNDSCGTNGKTPNKDMVVDRSEFGRSEGKRRKQQKRDRTVGETPIVLSPDSANQSEQGKVGRKRRVRKDKTASEALAYSDPRIVNVPVESKPARRYRKGKDGAADGGETAVNLCQEPLNSPEVTKVGQKMVRSKGVANGKSPVELGRELSGCPQEGSKSGQRGRKSKNAPHTLRVLDLDREIANGPNEGKSGQKRRKKDGNNYGNPAALHMNFAPGTALPSRDDLLSTFSKYGALIESETELLQETGSASVVFAKSTDAEKAFNSLDKTGVFGPSYATYRLRYLPALSSPSSSPIPVPKPPLPYIRKSLERMISSLTGSSTPVKETGSSDGLKPEARDNLVGEMQGLLKKVNKMLNGPAAGTPI